MQKSRLGIIFSNNPPFSPRLEGVYARPVSRLSLDRAIAALESPRKAPPALESSRPVGIEWPLAVSPRTLLHADPHVRGTSEDS